VPRHKHTASTAVLTLNSKSFRIAKQSAQTRNGTALAAVWFALGDKCVLLLICRRSRPTFFGKGKQLVGREEKENWRPIVLEHYPEREELSPYSAVALELIKVLAYPCSTALARTSAVVGLISRTPLARQNVHGRILAQPPNTSPRQATLTCRIALLHQTTGQRHVL
jgi:hypothetical protein